MIIEILAQLWHNIILNPVYWLLTISAIVGVYLNNHQDIRCFYIWIVTNACFAIETYILGAFNLTLLYLVYFGLAFHGRYKWKQRNKHLQALLGYNRDCSKISQRELQELIDELQKGVLKP